MAILPYNTIEAILLLLPLKSIIRFKCVSKPWHSLISNSLFIQSHLRRSYNRPLLLFDYTTAFAKHFHINNVVEILESYSSGGGESVSLDSIFPSLTLRTFHSQCNLMDGEKDSSYSVMCACDGLVVLKFPYCRGQRESPFYVIWNPFTRESREIHPISNRVSRSRIFGATFSFHVFKLNSQFVFQENDAMFLEGIVERSGKWAYKLYDSEMRKVATLETEIEIFGPAKLSTFLLHETLVSPNPNNFPWTSMGNYVTD